LLPYHRILALTLVVCAGLATPSAGESPPTGEDGIEERLGEIVPVDLRFVDEEGAEVRLGDLIDKPTIVSLEYYSCPSICRPLLDEVTVMLGKLQDMNMEPGLDYRVLTISFDETDSSAGSARLKDEYYTSLPDGFPASAWTFLTGDSAAVASFTDAVGFHFRRAGEDFAHPTTLVILSPKGKITRYLIGSEYLAADIKLSLMEASEGRVGPTIAKFFQYCFSYDPEGRKYVLNVTRVVGASSIIGLALFAVFLTAGGRRRSKEVG
jgi:protein SCO1/2